jgi:predicted transcriptional regulator
MVAGREATVSMSWLVEEDPRKLASELVEASRGRPGWLAALSRELESEALVDQLRWVLGVWGVSASEASRLFGVSRQAVSKWLVQGVPSERIVTVANLAAATDLLVRYLKPDRVPATVRRKASRLGDRSLLDLVAADDSHGVLEACRGMFDFSAAQA